MGKKNYIATAIVLVTMILSSCSEQRSKDVRATIEENSNHSSVEMTNSDPRSIPDETSVLSVGSNAESFESSVENKAEENHDDSIQYFNCLDDHTQELYNAFLAYDWETADDILGEFKLQKEGRMAVYTTPLDEYSLVIEYVPEVYSWQAYFGEFVDGQKKGMGVMVSRKERGDHCENVYIGEWDNNFPNGTGLMTDSIKDIGYVLEGKFVDGKLDSTIQIHGLESPWLYVDYSTWQTGYTFDSSDYAEMTFDRGTPIPVEKGVVDQYIELAEKTAYELAWLELENDGQSYYRILNNQYNYILTVGAAVPHDGYRGKVKFVYGPLFDSDGKQAIYGVACYSSNRIAVSTQS